VAWTAAVPDAAEQCKLDELVACVAEDNRAFRTELEQRMLPLLALPGGGRTWYRCDDPFACGFVGPGAGRAVIDRQELRQRLQDLLAEEYRVLIVTGQPGTGKTHSWQLIDHLQQAAAMMASHRFVRVPTHDMRGEVSGKDLALKLALKLGMRLGLDIGPDVRDAQVSDSDILDTIVGHYPHDGVTRWIVLDGLDRPLVKECARDAARYLIALVSDGELPKTRLIITGFDTLGFAVPGSYQVERIPPIDETLVSTFLATVASHLGCRTSPEELAALAAEVVEAGGSPLSLREVETAVVQLVKKRWAEGPGDDDW
jgi:hypothetical protein